MYRSKLAVTGLAALLALALACSRRSSTPTSPSSSAFVAASSGRLALAAAAAGACVADDAVTLKVTEPVPQSPLNDAQVQSVTLIASAATGKFTTVTPLQYRFRVFNDAGACVLESGLQPGPSFPVAALADVEKRHTWRARAEYQGAAGPWSSVAGSFIAPAGGYISGNELYDPLSNGKTVGVTHGPVSFIAGVGVKLETLESYVSYELPQTLTEGEFSLLATNIPANTEGDKTKLFAMGEGYDDIVTNDRRMTVEKRGDPPGVIAWRFITHDDQVDTEGPDRVPYDFQGNLTYFWQATWRDNFFNLLIKEGGADGTTIYNFGKPFDGRAYDPSPHVIYLGAPVGRSGPAGASVEGAIIRQVCVSSRPRPASANQ